MDVCINGNKVVMFGLVVPPEIQIQVVFVVFQVREKSVLLWWSGAS